MNTRNINLLPKMETAFVQENWTELLGFLDPKLFRTRESEDFVAFSVLAKVAQILTSEESVPENIKIACLKCLGNSCFNNYLHKGYPSTDIQLESSCNKLYSTLSNNECLEKLQVSNSYPFASHFPYEGVMHWTLNFIKNCKADSNSSNEKLEVLRLSIQFLCNLFTFACTDANFPDQYNIPQYLYDCELKGVIINLTNSDQVSLVRASCVFIHNALKQFEGETFSQAEKNFLCSQLLKPIKNGFESAKEALLFLLCHSNTLQTAYNDMTIENKLCLLEIIHEEFSNTAHESKSEYVFTKSTIEFLIERFCRRSDLILKTVDTYLDEVEPMEIVILLDILGTLTSGSCKEYNFLKGYRSLLINCTYLLKSIQMIGKQSENFFSPLKKLSDVASLIQGETSYESERNKNGVEVSENEDTKSLTKKDLHSHPAFGFKAGLIRIIGNICYRNKECQDLLREMDAIPLLLDCCNIDARNPLIMQWTILALRNLCEDNPANQEIIQNCSKISVVESSVLREMGVILHEDEEGKKIGIVPLPRDGE